MGYYLALGDSLAAGYQPDRGPDPTGGYADDVLAGIRATQPKTTLVNLACPGERSTTMVSGGTCPYDEGSQLDQALAFLHAHGRYTRRGDRPGRRQRRAAVREPSSTLAIDMACIQAGMADVATHLPTILGQAARRGARRPGRRPQLLQPVPRRLAARQHRAGPTVRRCSRGRSTGSSAAAAAASGATVADVATAFQSTDLTPVTVPGLGTVPTNVAVICANTWMCSRFDIHANDAGYALIGQTVVARLG